MKLAGRTQGAALALLYEHSRWVFRRNILRVLAAPGADPNKISDTWCCAACVMVTNCGCPCLAGVLESPGILSWLLPIRGD